MKDYQNIAVMDFIDSRGNSPTDQGKILARMLRRRLRKSKEFHILSERDMYLRLEAGINGDKIGDPDVLISVCDQLGADALIVGAFDFRRTDQPVPYIIERYSPRTGRYGPETRTYVQRVHRLSLRARVIDGTTGKTIFDYVSPPEERPELRNVWGFPLSGSGSDPTNLRSMAARPVANFALSLIPHYGYERRILAR
jgi:hypothetical protein